mgnify:CR=1 FL=1
MTGMIQLEYEEPGEENDDFRLRLLIASVVQRAVVDWVLYRGLDDVRKRRLYHEADQWLFRDDRNIFDDDGITFPEACLVLGTPTGVIRSSILSLGREDLLGLRRAFSG